ncbi:MAG: arginine decarboxylase [Chitinophagales bacterium]
MKTKYIDFINQTFEFPQEEFQVDGNHLLFNDIPLMEIIEQYGTPLKISYLPKISQNIQKVKTLFQNAFIENDYKAEYHFSYCTKSSHFSFVLNEALKNNIHIETSSAFDIDIVNKLIAKNKLTKENFVLCNGYKMDAYLNKIADLVNQGFDKTICIFDNIYEPEKISSRLNQKAKVGIRIASEEEPKFEFYTSRLGIGYKDIISFYKEKIEEDDKLELKMLHFFINTGMTDTSYYWNELNKSLQVYCQLKQICSTLDSINIGGGLPIKNSLSFEYDYQAMISEIIKVIKEFCTEEKVEVPHIFTEFGSYTVGESGATIFKVIDQKKQNDKEKWNMINSSFMTNLPDAWALNKKFVLLAINKWNENYERILLGGLTCDSDDYYNSEAHSNAIFLPKYDKENPLYIGFFHTGAYQDTISGYGGAHHCLIPQLKHILIQKDNKGNISTKVFAEEQKAEDVLRILGF